MRGSVQNIALGLFFAVVPALCGCALARRDPYAAPTPVLGRASSLAVRNARDDTMVPLTDFLARILMLLDPDVGAWVILSGCPSLREQPTALDAIIVNMQHHHDHPVRIRRSRSAASSGAVMDWSVFGYGLHGGTETNTCLPSHPQTLQFTFPVEDANPRAALSVQSPVPFSNHFPPDMALLLSVRYSFIDTAQPTCMCLRVGQARISARVKRDVETDKDSERSDPEVLQRLQERWLGGGGNSFEDVSHEVGNGVMLVWLRVIDVRRGALVHIVDSVVVPYAADVRRARGGC
ncbi:hypothetical protein JB92DRAFT_2825482 [Gautieria morchelliformis]|nr:hypothetical protein JB92DRAFT_2825482 [Gautieria morchelliformis]